MLFKLFLGLESLPTDLQRNFNLMRDLDTRSQGEDDGDTSVGGI